MNEFIEQCRSEWRRLGVPDLVADEMAAELAADLQEAAAEGVSAEEVLGSGAGDPRSFAAAWAGERGVIERPGRGFPRSSRVIAAIALFALIAIVGGALVITSRSGPTRLELTAPVGFALPPSDRAPTPVPVLPQLSGDSSITVDGQSLPARVWASRSGTVVEADSNDAGMETSTIGSALLSIGLAGVVPLTLFWLWTRRRTDSGRPSGTA